MRIPAPLPSLAGSPEIPDKLYFRIGDVSRLAGVKPHVLRYWETEFTLFAPKKSGTGQRLYRRKDVELVLEIKHLLYDKRFTIEGARKAIEARTKLAKVSKLPKPAETQSMLFGTPAVDLSGVRRELEEILAILRAD